MIINQQQIRIDLAVDARRQQVRRRFGNRSATRGVVGPTGFSDGDCAFANVLCEQHGIHLAADRRWQPATIGNRGLIKVLQWRVGAELVSEKISAVDIAIAECEECVVRRCDWIAAGCLCDHAAGKGATVDGNHKYIGGVAECQSITVVPPEPSEPSTKLSPRKLWLGLKSRS